jgi:class 3 adenylate cyclase
MDLRDVPEPATADGNLHCASLNIAARLLALAQPGGICLSQTAYEQVRNKLDLNFRPLGAYRVKNSGEPIRFYAVDPSMPAAARSGFRQEDGDG